MISIYPPSTLQGDFLRAQLLSTATSLCPREAIANVRVVADHLGGCRIWRVDRYGGETRPRGAYIYVSHTLATCATIERVEVLAYALLVASDWLLNERTADEHPDIERAARTLGICPTAAQSLDARARMAEYYRPGNANPLWEAEPTFPIDAFEDRPRCAHCKRALATWQPRVVPTYHDNCIYHMSRNIPSPEKNNAQS